MPMSAYFKSVFKRWYGPSSGGRLTYPQSPGGTSSVREEDGKMQGGEGTLAEQEQSPVARQVSQPLGSPREDGGVQEELHVNCGLRLQRSMSSTGLPSPSLEGDAEILSYKYWKTGSLGSEDQMCRGFYDVDGEFPELGPGEVFPDYRFLCSFEPELSDTREVVVVNPDQDPGLSKIEQQATEAFFASCVDGMLAGAQAIACVVCDAMGGRAEDDSQLVEAWSVASMQIKFEQSNSRPAGGALLVPIGSISPGLSRHRALLFKYLADLLCIPCRLLRQRSNEFSGQFQAMVILEIDGAELPLDLMLAPGALPLQEVGGADFLFGADSNITLSNRDSHMVQHQSLAPEDALSNAGSDDDGPVEINPRDILTAAYPDQGILTGAHHSFQRAASHYEEQPILPIRPQPPQDRNSLALNLRQRDKSPDLIDLMSPHAPVQNNQKRVGYSTDNHSGTQSHRSSVRPLSPLRNRAPVPEQSAATPYVSTMGRPQQPVMVYDVHDAQGHMDLPQDTVAHPSDDESSDDSSEFEFVESTRGERVWDPITDCLIDTKEIRMIQRLGRGSYGEVYRAEWQGTEVAVKQFLEQEMTDAVQEEFLQEVRIMKDLRHPNIVQFMGATWKPRGIVMQYMHRGSLFQLLHRNSKGKRLHMARRLRMALDVALGMRYLHSRKPMIVHRDLKSPNLLVARDWTVRLCDFGLSKLKSNTFLSTRSSGGTPEWMAPEVLRTEACNEKSDVYSFAVIMWELMFYSEPWHGTKPMQVVYLVGSNNQRLPLLHETPLNGLIEQCWSSNPDHRPSFQDIYGMLKEMQRPIKSNFEDEASGNADLDS